MKNRTNAILIITILVLAFCCSCQKKEKMVQSEAENLFVHGKYYRDSDKSKEYIEILSETKIDFSNADIDFIISDFKQLRQADFPDETEDELEKYLDNLENLLQQPYTFTATQDEDITNLRVYSIDGEDLSVKLSYNKKEGILLWGEFEYFFVEE